MRNSIAAALGFTLLMGCPHAAEQPPAEVALEVPRVDGGAAAAPIEPDDANTARFGREPAKVGTRTRQHVLARSQWSDEESSYASEFVIEVLAVEGPVPSRVQIEFKKNERFDNVGHQATPVDGKTYRVDVHAPNVVDAATGQPPTPDEIERVTDVLPDFGTRSQIDQVLPEGAMHVGESRDDIARVIARILHPRIWSAESAHATLARVERGEAVFTIELAATSSLTRMRMVVGGEARVRLRDAQLLGFELKGMFERTNGERGKFDVTRVVRDE